MAKIERGQERHHAFLCVADDVIKKTDKPWLFQKGQAGPGRPKGIANKVTQEARDLCGNLLDDKEYRNNFKARMIAGTLAPPLEQMVWYYRHGKPKETVELTGQNGGPLSVLAMTGPERVAYLRNLVDKVREPGDEIDEELLALADSDATDS